jgi:hypothetical protein
MEAIPVSPAVTTLIKIATRMPSSTFTAAGSPYRHHREAAR